MRSLGSVPIAENMSAYLATCSVSGLACFIFPYLQKYQYNVKHKNSKRAPDQGRPSCWHHERRNAGNLKSDYEHARVLIELLKRPNISAENVTVRRQPCPCGF